MVARLNRGQDVGGQPIGEPTAFHIGVMVSPCALNLDEEVRRLHYKVEAGAEFVITDPVFDPRDLTAFLERAGEVPVPIIARVCPIESLRHAEFLANEVPGLRVPVDHLRRIERADADRRADEEGLRIALEIARAVRPLVQGLQVAVSRDRLDAALAIVDAVRG